MQGLTISQVTKIYSVSTRTLRYYEQIGLIDSGRRDDYAYRVYDEAACTRLRQILTLRKLRIPLKQIAAILQNRETAMAVSVFMENIALLDSEIQALSTIRSILAQLAARLREHAGAALKPDLLNDETIISVVESLAPAYTHLKEERPMDALNHADDILSKLKDVRIVYLPPATVAASHHIGPESEHHAFEASEKFIRDVKLWELKPDLRSYGFNHPNEVKGTDYHGYECWVTIPDDMDVPAPLVKKHFPGGLYAAHMIKIGDFHEWEWLCQWGYNNPDYDPAMANDGGECMHGLLEECINYVNIVQGIGIAAFDQSKLQLDLLLPIKPKDKTTH